MESQENRPKTMSILLLPDVALETIFSFLPYDEIAKNRIICKKFNDIGGNLLSRGFMQIEKKHASVYKKFKALLPRRESERRLHPLFRRCDILSALETRISMLNMTYMKYIQNNSCCFIPGKVLDELERVLNAVELPGMLPRTHELLQELRDISSMAMEYFEEKILPTIKGQTSGQIAPFSAASGSNTNTKVPKVYFVPPGFTDEMRRLLKHNKRQRKQILFLAKIVQKLDAKIEKQNNTMKAQSTKLQEHESKLQEHVTKLQEQDVQLNELKKHIEDWDQKFSDLTKEMNRSRGESELTDVAVSPKSVPPKTFTRPRLSHAQTPNCYLMELERKRKSSLDFDVPHKIRVMTARESQALQLKEKMINKINENITQNISKNITQGDAYDDSGKKKQLLPHFLSNSIEVLLKNPINSIKSRKRRITEDLNLHNME